MFFAIELINRLNYIIRWNQSWNTVTVERESWDAENEDEWEPLREPWCEDERQPLGEPWAHQVLSKANV